MERASSLVNAWLILRTIGHILLLDGVLDFFSITHWGISRRVLLLIYYYFYGLDHDPAKPRPAESWEEWYNP